MSLVGDYGSSNSDSDSEEPAASGAAASKFQLPSADDLLGELPGAMTTPQTPLPAFPPTHLKTCTRKPFHLFPQ